MGKTSKPNPSNTTKKKGFLRRIASKITKIFRRRKKIKVSNENKRNFKLTFKNSPSYVQDITEYESFYSVYKNMLKKQLEILIKNKQLHDILTKMSPQYKELMDMKSKINKKNFEKLVIEQSCYKNFQKILYELYEKIDSIHPNEYIMVKKNKIKTMKVDLDNMVYLVIKCVVNYCKAIKHLFNKISNNEYYLFLSLVINYDNLHFTTAEIEKIINYIVLLHNEIIRYDKEYSSTKQNEEENEIKRKKSANRKAEQQRRQQEEENAIQQQTLDIEKRKRTAQRYMTQLNNLAYNGNEPSINLGDKFMTLYNELAQNKEDNILIDVQRDNSELIQDFFNITIIPDNYNYEYNISDNMFLDTQGKIIDAIIYNPLEWYKTINFKFSNLFDINPSIREFKPLLRQFVKDLLILLETKYFPDKQDLPKTSQELNANDSTYLARNAKNTFYKKKTSFRKYTENIRPNDKLEGNIIILLRNIFDIVVKDYKYVDCIKIYLQYIHLFSYGELLDVNTLFTHFERKTEPINISYCYQDYKVIFELLYSPYFIYPTFHKINDYKFLQLLRAPILGIHVFNNIRINKEKFTKTSVDRYQDMVNNRGHKISIPAIRTENINISKYIKPCLQIYYDIKVSLNDAHFIFNQSKNNNNEDIYTKNNLFVKWLNNYISDFKTNDAGIVLSMLKTIITMEPEPNSFKLKHTTYYLKDELQRKLNKNKDNLIIKFGKKYFDNLDSLIVQYN
jgi:hypothetical protein